MRPFQLLFALLAVHSADAKQRAITLGEFAKVALLTPTTIRSGVLAIALPYACAQVGFEGRDFEPALLSLIIATPSAFTINAAYQRRERALSNLASFRAASFSMISSVERWGLEEHRAKVRQELCKVYDGLCRLLQAVEDEDEIAALRDVYAHLAVIGELVDTVRFNPKAGYDQDLMPALSTLLHSDERTLVQNIEQLRMISTTGTPYLIRGFTVGGASGFPVIFAPYFASIADGPSLFESWAAYLVSFLFAVTISAIVSIQEALEDPFDGDTRLDDITLAAFAPPGCGEIDPAAAYESYIG